MFRRSAKNKTGTANASEGETASTLRLFVAVEIPHEVKRLIVDTIEALQRAAAMPWLRWVRPEGIHATLEFLGATPEARLAEIRRALAGCADASRPFDLAPLGIGSFGGRNVRVVWIGLGGDGGALSDLAEQVEESLEPLGLPRDQRAFNAHLTLARVRDEATPADRARLHDLLTRFDVPAFPTFRVAEFVLMQSVIGPDGAHYRPLATFPLKGE
jgi:2'-5' RNA ligase